jgi:hypothetical protein
MSLDIIENEWREDDIVLVDHLPIRDTRHMLPTHPVTKSSGRNPSMSQLNEQVSNSSSNTTSLPERVCGECNCPTAAKESKQHGQCSISQQDVVPQRIIRQADPFIPSEVKRMWSEDQHPDCQQGLEPINASFPTALPLRGKDDLGVSRETSAMSQLPVSIMFPFLSQFTY